MKLRAWAWLALSSTVAVPLGAATRPHYGGTLTIQLSGAWSTLDDAARSALSIPIAEPLVRINSRGQAEPVLAVAWQHDPDYKEWRFSLRSKVKFHDDQALTAASAVPALTAALKPGVLIEGGGQALLIKSAEPLPGLLEQLAHVGISRAGGIGTGPFRVTAWEPGRRLALAAFDDYWGGRPFLDAVSMEFGAARGRAELFDIPLGPARRILPEGFTTWSSLPRTLVAIEAVKANPLLSSALALAIDRAPIANVLAQHRAEPAFGLLPPWLSGYEFLFEAPPDLVRARQMAAQLPAAPVGLSYPANDPFLRLVAERIALNARDAGLTIQPSPSPSAQLQLVERPLESTDAAYELKRAAGGDHPDLANPQARYEFERAVLDSGRIIPLIYLRETFGIAPRLHFEPSSDMFALHLEDAWLEP